MHSTETLDAIASRHSCRAYLDTPVPAELLRIVVQAGLHAPSAVNRQPWRLIVVTDPEVLTQIGTIGLANLKANDPGSYARIQSRGGRLLYDATAMIIVATDSTVASDHVAMDAGIVASHVALAATAVGLNSCIAALPGLAFTASDGQELTERVIPAGFSFAISVLLGYGVEPDAPAHPIDESKVIYRTAA
ncbi:MAG: nitroreductase family protein [Propionibacteriaceae bacterium]|jgi:nitroreductase|nr:nitroreductase family protein [Propionibacteriaceae bacterium]